MAAGIGLTAGVAVHAEVFKCAQPDGRIAYSERPCPTASKSQQIELRGASTEPSSAKASLLRPASYPSPQTLSGVALTQAIATSRERLEAIRVEAVAATNPVARARLDSSETRESMYSSCMSDPSTRSRPEAVKLCDAMKQGNPSVSDAAMRDVAQIYAAYYRDEEARLNSLLARQRQLDSSPPMQASSRQECAALASKIQRDDDNWRRPMETYERDYFRTLREQTRSRYGELHC